MLIADYNRQTMGETFYTKRRAQCLLLIGTLLCQQGSELAWSYLEKAQSELAKLDLSEEATKCKKLLKSLNF